MSVHDKKRAKLIDVARHAGVSPGTVSNALHNTRFVEPETRQRIEEAIQALNYTPNIRARQLRTGKTNTIALLSSLPLTIASGASKLGFMMEIALTAAIMALEKQHALILVPPGKNPLDMVTFDAAILLEPAENDPQLRALEQAGIPCITIGRTPGTPTPVPWVDLHSAATATLLLTHLQTQGADRCALFVGTTRRASTLETEAAYQLWCEGRQAPVIYYLNEEEGETAGYQAARRLVQDNPDVDGLLVLVDTFASGAVRAFHETATAIPQRMRLATRYDGIRARESQPPLTSVNMHLDEVARQAITLLFAVLAGQNVAGSRGQMPELVVRASSRLPELS
ncbi:MULTISPECIES: substrate-binding domain-containing protein [Raoultella]|jgi:DNA-binding LacI/PurR family transcriptional regulator|uniref:LacI family DNA-binding transcriptional regulator n=1 Tax=Raoultella planticola TaxID=575 RepID=A0A443VIK8_RAOPL|nr:MULTISPECIES: substrate-binding domain-containing protein [Raoultella]MDU4422175.1 substrate-binding domain-containing protein [Raoultella sp.]AUV53618.1 LacI family transcriptional regulator [Raoultella planticola]EKW3528742.1 substrate-binding domain-containing protein [Raoultella planticola]ELC3571776.1 substrate-binding domain-containing protein [Raoultella planticola]ELF4971378.1 substrate-binding domain-containing protein [Raoultella planticola]